ncbi:MAG: leucine-rich repeat protein, partial [Clostridia bacterium]|nr:leucine-rich repeat protein [Clostridia bacterium]
FNGAAIKELVIPASVTTIGQEAFANCRSLTKVTMPSSFNDEATLKSIFLSQYKNIQFTFVD